MLTTAQIKSDITIGAVRNTIIVKGAGLSFDVDLNKSDNTLELWLRVDNTSVPYFLYDRLLSLEDLPITPATHFNQAQAICNQLNQKDPILLLRIKVRLHAHYSRRD